MASFCKYHASVQKGMRLAHEHWAGQQPATTLCQAAVYDAKVLRAPVCLVSPVQKRNGELLK